MIPRLLIPLALAAALAAGLATAADKKVHQKGSAFDPERMSVRVGEAVVFVNDDKVAHNVMSGSKAAKFNLGLQKPGDSKSLSFDEAGEVEIRCAIHPKMKMVIEVVE